MSEARSGKTELELRSLLGCFLFSGDDADKKIKLLSGGEKARVALAKVIVSKSNFMMLDEPTNHLDMHSVELLAEALNKYEGSLILVSHDRFFVSKTANKIWEIIDHEIKEFKGGYTEYLEWKERMAKQAKEEGRKQQEPKAKVQEAITKPQDTRNKNQEKPRVDNTELKNLQKKFQKIEQELEGFKKKKEAIEAELGNPDSYKNAGKFAETEKNYKAIQAQVKQAETEYEQLFEKIMELESVA
jgi:ATP-binding cassette subfamily F protein 3